MTVCIRPINKNKTPGFTLDSLWTDESELISWLIEAGMEQSTHPKKKHHHRDETDVILSVNAPESIEATLADTIDNLTSDNTKSLGYIQQLDDLVFDSDTPFPEADPSKSRDIPAAVSEIYEDMLGDNASSYFSDKRFKILVLSCVYVCIRAYSECSIQITATLPESEQKKPMDSNKAVDSIPDDHAREIIGTATETHTEDKSEAGEEAEAKSATETSTDPDDHKSKGKAKTHKRGKSAKK